jgi:hypothetical protein
VLSSAKYKCSFWAVDAIAIGEMIKDLQDDKGVDGGDAIDGEKKRSDDGTKWMAG